MRGWKRWLVLILGAALVLGLIATVAVFAVSEYWLRHTFEVPDSQIQVVKTGAAVARGEHLATSVAICVDCHGEDLSGQELLSVPLLGHVTGTNLTPGKGSVMAGLTDAQLERAIRHSVKPDGRGLLVMPSQNFFHFSDADTAALIAYLRQLKPVDREWPKRGPGMLVRGPVALGLFNMLPAREIQHFAQREAAPDPGPTAEYGKYLVSVAGCRDCHGTSLTGGRVPGSLADAPGLTKGSESGAWSVEEFTTAMRQGSTPEGETIAADEMPWGFYAGMTDEELEAMARYLQSLP